MEKKNLINNMTFEEKLKHIEFCSQSIRNFDRYVEEAEENGNKDLMIEYLKLKSEKALEIANIFASLLEEQQKSDFEKLSELYLSLQENDEQTN